MATEKANRSSIEFPVPPSDEGTERLNINVPKSLKWRAKLHLMHLESEGLKNPTFTDYVVALMSEDLDRLENARARRR